MPDPYKPSYPNTVMSLLLDAVRRAPPPASRFQPAWPDPWRDWGQVLLDWLGTYPVASTRRHNFKTCDDFLNFTYKTPWEISAEDIHRWSEHLSSGSYSAKSVRNAIGVLSSFYKYAARQVDPILGKPLIDRNPAKKVLRPRLKPYQEARWLDGEEIKCLLDAIDVDTLYGKRDYALLLTALHTGQLMTDVRLLRRGQIGLAESGPWYERPVCRRGKRRGELERCPLSADAWNAIFAFLRSARPMQAIQPSDPLFPPLCDLAGRMQALHGQDWRNRPITATNLRIQLKRYALWADVDLQTVTPQSIRYTAALLRLQAGDDLHQLTRFLGLSSPAATRAMLRNIAPDRLQVLDCPARSPDR